ncbi:ABC transporter permease subunit [Microlunatus speluncae]|uniref:ABC transporter permease subunit n=1 Tax=Microlunatus speluncae TaxID=2594267 RepID=UPI0012665E39|nr:ABC transporter permease subunit [Microlunatus speluncae]
MIGVLRAELIKVRADRPSRVLLILGFVLGIGSAVLTGVLAIRPELAAGQPATVLGRDASAVIGIYNGAIPMTRILALVAGALAMSREYSHKTLALTYLSTPNRYSVIGAKAGAQALIGLIIGLVSVLIGFVVATVFIIVTSGSFFLDQAGTWGALLLGVLSIAVWSLIGCAAGVLIRDVVITLAITLGFCFLVDPTVAVIFADQGWTLAQNLLPSGATAAMVQSHSVLMLASANPFPPGLAALVLIGWCLIPGVIGTALTISRDVE